MSLRIIFGAPGAGKSTFNTYLLISEYWEQGFTLHADTCARIEELNKERTTPLTLPDRPPIYADYRIQLLTGYEEYFTPYFVDGFHLGLENADVPPRLQFNLTVKNARREGGLGRIYRLFD